MNETDYRSPTLNFGSIDPLPWEFPRRRMQITTVLLAVAAAVAALGVLFFAGDIDLSNPVRRFMVEWLPTVAVWTTLILLVAAWIVAAPVRRWWGPRIDLIRFMHRSHVWLNLFSMLMLRHRVGDAVWLSITDVPPPESVRVDPPR